MVAAEKLPPFDIEAEEAVIASILVDEDAIGRVEGVISPEDFYRDQNRWAYEACLALWQRGETLNQVMLADPIKELGDYQVAVKLSKNVSATVSVSVIGEDGTTAADIRARAKGAREPRATAERAAEEAGEDEADETETADDQDESAEADEEG